MTGTELVHECLFCSQIFDSATAKDDHILEHFAQETCVECNRNLIRIGGSFYMKHDSGTCLKRYVKIEEHVESCFSETLIVQNDTECEPNNLQCIDGLNYNDATARKSDNQARVQELNDLIDYRNYIPDLQWGDSREQSSICASISIVPKQSFPVGEANVKTELVEQSSGQHASQILSLLKQPVYDAEILLPSSADTMFCNIPAAECMQKERKRKFKQSGADLQCNLCNTKFESKAIYGQHMRRKHGGTKANFKCEQCNIAFIEKLALENHHCSNKSTESSGGEMTIACDICEKTFNHKSSVYRHKLLLHTPAETIVCNVCGRRFDDCKSRDMHREECALKARLRKSASSGELECNFCQKKFRLDESLRRHIRIKHDEHVEKFQCNLCKALFMKESSLNAHICPKRSEHPCDLCGRKLSNARTLQTHKILLHSEPGTIFCSVCSKLFTTAEARDQHKLECSLRSKMYKLKSYGRFECDLCHKKFGTKGNLRQHMRRKHDPNAEDFRCKSCRTIFMTEKSLQHHQCKGKPTNASQRFLISCELCGKVLQKCALSRHKLLMHRAPDAIYCQICVKIFPSVNDLNEHLPQCKKSFRRACNICGKILANPRVLARHKISLHSAPGTIFCKTCVKKFKTVEELNAHMPECTLKRKLQKFQKQSQMADDCIKLY